MAGSQNRTQSPLIFISAAEQSADLHGANLIRAARKMIPVARFVGVAGPRMVAAGCEPIFDMTRHAAMLLGALKVAGKGLRMLRTADEHLRRCPFDAAVVIDSPTLHLPISARAHRMNIPVLYYIAPQLWAWGTYRIHKLRNQVDRVAAILPFEEKFFRDQGVNATYVGHPLAEHCAETGIDYSVISRIKKPGSPLVALLPGSRSHVVESILPGQLEVAARIRQAIPDARFAVSVANDRVVEAFNACNGTEYFGGQIDGAGTHASAVNWIRSDLGDHHAELIRAADLVLVASGTSTLEVAFHQRPMLVMYQASRLFYHLFARWMLHTRHFALPNILAGREIVPEFMPYYSSTEPIAHCAIDLLKNEASRRAMESELAEVVAPLKSTWASQRTAQMLSEMIAHGHHQ